MSTPVELILKPYTEGKSCIVLQGRSLSDFEVNSEGKIQPLIEILRHHAFAEHNLVMIQYSRSQGITYDLSDCSPEDKTRINDILQKLIIPQNQRQHQLSADYDEFVPVLRNLLNAGLKLSEPRGANKPLRFLILIEYAEHLLQPHERNANLDPNQAIAIELALKLANSLGFRKSGNYTVLSESRPGLMDPRIYRDIELVSLAQPDITAKGVFFDALAAHYAEAQPSTTLSKESVINLSAGTPNRSLEAVLRSSDLTHRPYQEYDLIARKQDDIVSLSEGTLELIDTSRVLSTRLAGRNIEKPLNILMKVVAGLKNGEKNSPRNICLCGAPSTGKTVLTLLAAAKAGVPAFNLISPKSQWVGESERRTKVMLTLLKQLGGIGLIDELELQFPMDRSQSSLDSGVTQNLIGQLQSFLADTSTAGKTLLLGTSNRPNAISEAMRQRWIILPVLMPIVSDYPAIIYSIAKELNPEFSTSQLDVVIKASAVSFYVAGAAPREIREAMIASQAWVPGPIDLPHIAFAAADIIPAGQGNAGKFSDYVALSYCRNNSFLPWWDEKLNAPDRDYPYPEYIKDIMTPEHLIDRNKLQEKIAELEPNVNV